MPLSNLRKIIPNKASNNNNKKPTTTATATTIEIITEKSCPETIVQIQSFHKHNQGSNVKYFIPVDHSQH